MSIFILKFDSTRAVSHDTSNSVAYCIMLLLYDKKTLYINIFLYTCRGEMEPTDDGLQKLVKTMKALANPIRLRIIALLEKEPRHAYALAKELGISYPLAHIHIKGLKKIGLIEEIENVDRVGLPSVKTYAPTKFKIELSSEKIYDIVLKEEKNNE